MPWEFTSCGFVDQPRLPVSLRWRNWCVGNHQARSRVGAKVFGARILFLLFRLLFHIVAPPTTVGQDQVGTLKRGDSSRGSDGLSRETSEGDTGGPPRSGENDRQSNYAGGDEAGHFEGDGNDEHVGGACSSQKWDRRGFSQDGVHRETDSYYGPDGFDFYGYDQEGYDREGYDSGGYNRRGSLRHA